MLNYLDVAIIKEVAEIFYMITQLPDNDNL